MLSGVENAKRNLFLLSILCMTGSDTLNSRIRIESSATIANFGPGYDTFGLCLENPSDVLEMELREKPGIKIEVAEEGFSVPTDSDHNTASVAALEIMRFAKVSPNSVGLKIRILKTIRPGSGLGSSASSAVAGAVGAAVLFDITDQNKILRAAAHGEGASSGALHIDNVAPCIFGGFTVILDYEKLRVLRISPPEMKVVVCLPEILVETAEARRLIPKLLPVNAVVSHAGWASGVIHGMETGDIPLIASCMKDVISVPVRRELIKGYEIARSAALASGALSFSICGSGPAVFSLARGDHKAIGEAIVEGFAHANVKSSYFIAKPGTGAKIVQHD